MNTLFTGNNFIELKRIDSTNRFARDLLTDNPPDGTVVFTREQTSGKGRNQNKWISPKDKTLTFSIIYYPQFLCPSEIFWLSKVVSCAIHKYLCSTLSDQNIQVKWPNDLLINSKKVCGILIETSLQTHKASSAVIGVGININNPETDHPDMINACSIGGLLGKTLEIRTELDALLSYIEVEYLMLRSGKRQSIARYYLQNLLGYQEIVTFEIDGEQKALYLAGVDASGQLALEENGHLKYFSMDQIKFTL